MRPAACSSNCKHLSGLRKRSDGHSISENPTIFLGDIFAPGIRTLSAHGCFPTPLHGHVCGAERQDYPQLTILQLVLVSPDLAFRTQQCILANPHALE